MFSSILGRNYDAAVERVAINDSSYLEQIYASICQIDINQINKYDLIVIEADTYKQPDNLFAYLKLILSITKGTQNIIVWHALPPNAEKKSKHIRDLLVDLNMDNISYLNMDCLFYEHKEECSYSLRFVVVKRFCNAAT